MNILEKFLEIVLKVKIAFAQTGGAQPITPGGAQPISGGGNITLQSPIQTTDIYSLLNRIADYLIWIAVPITTIMILYGAFQILTAAGDPAKAKSGRSTIIYAIVGLMIVVISKGVVYIIKEILGTN